MCQWIAGLCAAAALAVGMLCSPSFCRAKPPDLPRDIKQRCPEGFDGPQAEGFPAPSEPPSRPSPDFPGEREEQPSPLSPLGRGVGGEGRSPSPVAGAAEEQDALPERRSYREPTENRRANLPAMPQRRHMDRSSNDDARRLEMLRQTEPLDTQPQGVAEHGVSNDEAPSTSVTDSSRQYMPRADEVDDRNKNSKYACRIIAFTLTSCDELSTCQRFQLTALLWTEWAIDWTGLMTYDSPKAERVKQSAGPGAMHRMSDDFRSFPCATPLRIAPDLEYRTNSIGLMSASIHKDAFREPIGPDFNDAERSMASCCPGFASPIMLRPFVGVSETPYLDELCERFGVRAFDCDGSVSPFRSFEFGISSIW